MAEAVAPTRTAEAAFKRPRYGRSMSLPQSNALSFYGAIAPFFILFGVFSLFPIAFSFYLGFHSWDGSGAPRWVGFANYASVLNDPVFLKAVWNTVVVWFWSTLITVSLAFVLAYLVNEYVAFGRNYFRIVFLVPLLVAPAISAIILRVFFSSHGGIVNGFLGALSGNAVYWDWLGSETGIKPLIVLLIVWRWTGWHFIIFLAGLQAIPRDLYEAAKVDGAGGRQIFYRITLPLMAPTLAFSITNATLGGIQIFDEPFVLTNGIGGTDNAGTTLGMFLYGTAFTQFQFGLGSAVSWYIFAIVTGLTLLYHAALRRRAL